jgi:hypothetical protein
MKAILGWLILLAGIVGLALWFVPGMWQSPSPAVKLLLVYGLFFFIAVIGSLTHTANQRGWIDQLRNPNNE